MPDSLKYIVISQKGFKCPFCIKAVDLLDSKGLSYSLRPLEREHLLVAAKAAKMNTVPIIYYGPDLIGGYTDLMRHLDRRE